MVILCTFKMRNPECSQGSRRNIEIRNVLKANAANKKVNQNDQKIQITTIFTATKFLFWSF